MDGVRNIGAHCDRDIAHQITQPIWIDVFRPRLSERYPETRAPSQEPPGMAAVMPPCTSDEGPRHLPFSSWPRVLNLHRYGSVEMMALMELISNPKRAPGGNICQ